MIVTIKRPGYRWGQLMFAALFGLLMAAMVANTAHASSTTEAQYGAAVDWRGDGDDNERPRFYGMVEQMPEGGRVGEWLIGGKTVVADGQTQFDETEGAIGLGVCVKVELMGQGSTVAREIDSEPLSDCNDDGEGGAELYGIIETLPATGTIGVWIVSSKAYTVTPQSELKMEYGAFDIGRCVKIHLVSGTTDVVREIETERSYKCSGGMDDDDSRPTGVIGKGEVYGELKEFPQDRIGAWIVGALTFTATADTEFSTKNGSFEIGKIVKVEFYILQDGTFLAREIKIAMADWGDDGDEHEGDHDRGHAFGRIEQLPGDGLVGEWVVAGIPYSVTERTELHSRGGTFAISETVKVEFKVDSSGVRVAKEIKLLSPQGAPGAEDAKFVGFIGAMPENGYTGQWDVNGVVFLGVGQSKFKEDHGAFTIGAFVKVEYRTVNGERIIHEMETEVPPGAGDDNHVGKVESMDDGLLAASVTANSTWVVGGRSFVVTPSTRVDGALASSDTAWVNSYTATDGSQVATRIEGLTLNNFIYLPVTQR